MTAPNAEQIAAEAADAEQAAAEEAAAANAESALGDKGKQALDRMKAERNQFRDQLNAYKNLGLAPEKLQELIGKSESDAQAAEQERVRREAETAALAKANDRLVRAEIKAAAAGKMANPALALKLLDLSSFDVGDDGEVDSAAITAALDDLLSKEPYLGVTQGDTKRFKGTGDGGPKGSAGKPQLTREDLKKMTPTQILNAKAEGRMNHLLGIT